MINTDKKNIVKLISTFASFDGGLYKRNGKKTNASFIMNMRAENADYVEMVARVLEEVTSVTVVHRKDYNTDGFTRSPQVRLYTQSHPQLTKLHSRIYIDKHKVIDPHMLKLMDAEMLAIIFMCDGGSRSYKSNRSKRFSSDITLNTKGFSYGDNLILSKAIYESTGIITKVNKQNQYRYLRVPVKSHKLFIETVMPFITPSFRYKIERLAPAMGDDIVWTPWEHSDIIGD